MSSPGILSPATGAILCESGRSVISSLGEAHPDSKKTIVKNEAIGTATRLITAANLTTGKFDASSAVR